MVSKAILAERKVSPFAEWAKTVSFFSLVLLVTSGAGHRYGLVETIAFFWLLAIVAMLALAGLLLAVVGFSRLWQRGEKAGRASLSAALIALLVLVPFGFAAWFHVRYPALTDISTDLADPPRFAITPRYRVAGMNPIAPISRAAAELQARSYPEVSGRRYEASMERVLNAVRAVLAAYGWTPRHPLPAELLVSEFSFETQAPSRVLRLPADAAIRMTDEGESVFVDMRLNQRYGQHDLGEGARRIHDFMTSLDAEFARQSMEIIDIPASDGEENAVD